VKTAHRAGVILIVAAALWPAARVAGQRAGSTSLLVNVVPESQLTPSRLSMRFNVSADGSADDLRQISIVTARVRTLPNHPIHLTARMGAVTGPSGAAPQAIVEWSGSSLAAAGGAQGSTCTSGSLAAGASQDLVAEWPTSGSITCRIAFRLANPRDLPPGSYTASLDLAITE
jgi:hypothetical protein